MGRMSLLCRLKKLVHKGELEEKDLERIVIIPKEQEPCEDCISREAVLGCLTATKLKELKKFDLILHAREEIKKLPPVTPKPMQVDLEADGYSDGQLVYDYGKCPKCGWEFEYGEKDWEEPYCCHCGQRLHWFESEGKE